MVYCPSYDSRVDIWSYISSFSWEFPEVRGYIWPFLVIRGIQYSTMQCNTRLDRYVQYSVLSTEGLTAPIFCLWHQSSFGQIYFCDFWNMLFSFFSSSRCLPKRGGVPANKEGADMAGTNISRRLPPPHVRWTQTITLSKPSLEKYGLLWKEGFSRESLISSLTYA